MDTLGGILYALWGAPSGRTLGCLLSLNPSHVVTSCLALVITPGVSMYIVDPVDLTPLLGSPVSA